MSLFRRKKKNKKNFADEIIEEIQNCDKLINKYQQEIIEIKHLARDLTANALSIPEKYKYEELENYEKIINSEQNKDIDDELKKELLQICNSYYNHLEIRKEKVKICIENRKKLQKILSEAKSIDEKLQNETDKRQQIIENHKKIIKKLESSDIAAEIENTEKTKLLEEEITKLKNKLKEEKIFTSELKKLLAKYDGLQDLKSANTLLSELKSLLK